LQRLLSDPFSLPVQFKTWLVSYLESSDMSLPMSAIHGLTAMLGISGVGSGTLGIFPAGLILPYGGLTAPTGALLCDGSPVSRTGQLRLYTAIGTTYGVGDGSTTFNVPDLRGRVPVGKGSHTDVDTLGKTEVGVTLPNRRPKHRHSPHVHSTQQGNGAWGSTMMAGGSNLQTSVNTTAVDGGSGNANDSLDAPAFAVLNFIIIA
jgi:microcystin-dependent protein